MCENQRESFLNSKILANHFRRLCKNFSPPFKDKTLGVNPKTLELNNEILHFLTQTGRLIKEEKIDLSVFKNDIINIKNVNLLHLEVLWYLEVSEIITLKECIQFHENDDNEEVIKYISEQIYENILMQKRDYSKLRTEMLIAYFKAVIEHPESEVASKKTYSTVLNLIALNLKEFYECKESFEGNLVLGCLVDIFDNVQLLAVKLFLNKILKLLLQGLSHTTRSIFKKQENVKNNFKGRKILQFFDVMVKYCDQDELAGMLETILLESDEINWENLFPFITFLGNLNKDGWSILRKMINSFIKISFQNSDTRLLSFAFLIARQGCFEKSNNFFPSYLQWFSSTFSVESRRPVNSKQVAVFFFNFLTDLVPFDSTYYSKVHINRAPWVPIDCHSFLNDYVTVVKTHLCDLNVSVELGICDNTTGKSAAVFDVENVLKHFERTNEILNSVFQASMFCKEYFEKKFLVELISKFEGKKSARHKLIVKLHSLGKIPNSVFKTYKSLEKKK